jgi:hypothetical protein
VEGRGRRAAGRGGFATRMGRVLDAALRASIGGAKFGLDGRLRESRSALVRGVDEALLDRHLLENTRLRHPDSGAVLALNSFLNWGRCPELLCLAGVRGFRELRFDARCPTGIRGTPPLFEMVGLHEHGVVAVTARCTEYLARCRSKLADGYAGLAPLPGLEPWLELMAALRHQPALFRHVDAPALAKHALGVGQTFPDRPAILLYLYLEPGDAGAMEPFRTHRAELARLSALVDGAKVRLVAQTFNELWAQWQELSEPPWLRGIAARLRSRYDVAIGDAAGL